MCQKLQTTKKLFKSFLFFILTSISTMSMGQCSCAGNLVANPSFESGTTSWYSSGGTLSTGGGAVACGSFSGDFQITNTSSNEVSQVISSGSVAVGSTINLNVYAGTHDNSFYHAVAVQYFTSSWGWIGQNEIEVNKVLSNSPVGPQLYSINSIVPANTYYIKVVAWGNGSWIKTDGWCVTVSPPAICDPNSSSAASGFCAPAPICASGNFSWQQSIDQANGNPSIVKLISGSTNSYTISSGFPTAFSGNVTINLSDVVAYDGYSTRNSVTQTNEKYRFIFKKSGTTIYTSPYTNDLPDLQKQAFWRGSLGTSFNAPNGIDQIVIEHYDVANGYSSPGSVIPSSFCLTYSICSNVTNGGTIGFDELFCGTSFNPANITNITLPTGGTGTLEYIWLKSYDGGINDVVISGATGPSYDPGVITQTTWYRRCARRSGCTDYDGESNWVKKEISTCCDNVTNGGAVGYAQTYCGTSFDPPIIQNLNLPTGGTGTIEYIWLKTTDPAVIAGTSTNYSVISGSTSASYDPGIITQTTWYRRCARRSGCSSYVGETDWIKMEICPLPSANAGTDKNLSCNISSTTIGTTALSGVSYSWSPSTGLNTTNVATPTASPLVTTNYTVTVTNSCGCTATDAVTVNVNTTVPTANAGANQEINCTTASSVQIGTTAVAGNTYLWSNGSTSATQTVNPTTTTTYTVTVTNTASGCTATDAVTVNVNTTVPTANAGADKTITCTTTSATIGTTAVAGNTYLWSNGSTSATQTVNPTTTTTYTVTITNTASGCTATDAVTVNVNITVPTANAGANQEINCTTASSVQIGTTAIAGNTYLWSNGSTAATQTVNPTTTTTYTVTVTNTASSCTAMDFVTVNVNTTLPTTNAGPDKNLNCITTSTQIGTNALSGNTYSWSNGATTAVQTVNPTATSTYTLTVTNTASGCSSTDEVTVNVNQTIPSVNAGNDKEITCTTTSVQIGTIGIVGNSYSWSPATGLNSTTIPQPNVTITANQTYTVTVTNAVSGCTATDVVIVNVNTTVPTANAGNDKNLNCTTTSTIIGTSAINGNTYLWSNGATTATQTVSPTSTSNYMVTVTNTASGCTATDMVTVNVNTTVPTANAGSNTTINCTSTSASIGTTAIVGNTYLWSNGSTAATQTVNPTTTTNYTITVTNNASGCTAIDVVTVTVNTTPPTIDAGADKNLNCSITSTQIGTIGQIGNSYSWTPSTGLSSSTVAQPIASPTSTQTYTLTVTKTSNGCTATDVVTVNVNTTLPTVDAGSNMTVDCNTTSATIGTTAIAGNTYLWSNGSTAATQTVSPTTTTNYTITATGTNGCTATDVVTVNVNTTSPTVDAGSNMTVDCNTTSATIGTTAIAGNTYLWSNGSTAATQTVSPTTTTNYTITATGTNGCTATDVVTVNVNTTSPTVDAGSNMTVDCNTTSATIGTTAIAGNTYLWSNGSTAATQTVSPTTTTNYTITATGTNGCTATDVVTVNVNTTLPTVDAGSNMTVDCNTTSATIGTTAVAGNTYLWSNGSTAATQTVSPTTTTNYTITATGTNGCTATDVVTVNVNTTLPTVDAGSNMTVDCNTTSATIGTTAIAGNTYLWSNGSTAATQTVSPTTTTNYTITATGTNGCTATDVVTVNVNTTLPTVDAGSNMTVDCNTTSATIGTTAIAGNTYLWSNGSTAATQTVSPTTTTNYTITATGTNGCTAIDVVTVNANFVAPIASITGNLEVCNGSMTTLTASGNGSILWSNNSTTNQIVVGAGTYSVTITDGVCSSTSSVTVQNKEGSIGNYVWLDINLNGIQDDGVASGINNVTVELWSTGTDNVIGGGDDLLMGNTITNNDNNNNAGYYNFKICTSGNYYVKFPTNIENNVLTATNQTPGLDFNSDANSNGVSEVVTIDVNGIGIAKDNNTIDAGYVGLKYIGNRVWFDENQNGIQDNNEIGVARITVGLIDVTSGRIVASTVTDAYGYYLFNNLPTSNYQISFTLPSGYVFTNKDAGSDNELDSDVNPSNSLTDVFTYTAGTIDLSFDAGIYTTTPSTAKVGDRVWNDTDKDGIQDATETGVAGITVTLFNNNNEVVASTITDADGLYLFNEVTPGVYYVNYSLPIGYLFTQPNSGNNVNEDSNPNINTGNTPTFTVNGGDDIRTIDAGIYSQDPILGTIGNNVWNDVNNNGIQDANESGVIGVTVTLYDETGLNIIKSTTTDKLGNYIFNGLTAGSYIVGFSDLPVGFNLVPALQGNDDSKDSNPNTITGKTSLITLLSGQTITTIDAGINNPNLPTSSLGDYVWFDRNLDGIQSANENGVPGVTVSLFNTNDELINTTITNNEGFYIFNNLIAGTYYVNFSNLPAGTKLTIENQGGDDALDSDANQASRNSDVVTLGNNETNLTLDAGIVANDRRSNNASLGDFVWNDANNNGIQDEGELGVQGVTVTLYQENGITPITSIVTDALGKYIFTDLEEGSYVVGFSNLPFGYSFSAKNLGNDIELDADVDAASGGKTNIIFLPQGELNETIDAGIHQAPGFAAIGDLVWNDINQNGLQDAGEPGITGVSVTLYNAQNEPISSTTTDANGSYQFTGLVPGTYQVRFENLPANYLFTTSNTNGNSQDELDSDANPVTGFTSLITVVANQYYTGIDAGIYTLKSSLGNYVWEDNNYNGIQDANENGISGVTVTLYDVNNSPVTMTITDTRGQYNFVNLDPGTYSIGLSNLPGNAIFSPKNVGNNVAIDSDIEPTTNRSNSVTLVASEYNPTLDAGIYLPNGAGLGDYVWLDISGNNLQDAFETGIAGVTVTLYDEAGNPVKSTVTTQSGAYAFVNLLPGTYSVGFSTLPTLYSTQGEKYTTFFVTQNAGNDNLDSDADPLTGMTGQYVIASGQFNPTVDAGLKFGFALPAKLLLATSAVLNNDNTVRVNFKTETEDNTKLFEIERSIDGVNFVKVGTTQASGATIGEKNYSFVDDVTSISNKELISYRVRLIDIDNKFTLSNIVSVKIFNNEETVMVYPTLFSDKVNILYQAENVSSIHVQILDLNGNIITEKNSEVSMGKNILTVDNLSRISNGMYMIRITDLDNNAKYVFRINKQ